MEECLTRRRQGKSGKCKIIIINKKQIRGNIIIDTDLIISNINIFDIDLLDKLLLFRH
jgi:hypothetical protein